MRIKPSNAKALDSSIYLPLGVPPKNESEVIELFHRMARHCFGISDYSIQNRFPDCVARRGKKHIRIEFEFESRNFQTHGHDPVQCDWVVCWRDTWGVLAPRHLNIVALRDWFQFRFNVWFQPCANQYADRIGEIDFDDQWSVASKSSVGDLLLFYRALPQACVRDLFVVDGPVQHVEAGWKEGSDYMASISRVATLAIPLTWGEMRAEERLRGAGFLNGAMAGRPCASAYWHVLLEMIVARNPSLSWLKEKFDPDEL